MPVDARLRAMGLEVGVVAEKGDWVEEKKEVEEDDDEDALYKQLFELRKPFTHLASVGSALVSMKSVR